MLAAGAAGSGEGQLAAFDPAAGGVFHRGAEAYGDLDLMQVDHRIAIVANEVDMGLDIAIEALDTANCAQALDQTLLLEQGQIPVHRGKGDIRVLRLQHLMQRFR